MMGDQVFRAGEGRGDAHGTDQTEAGLVPDKPGCYLMKNDEGEIIYVGKAKVLRNRVRSYFTGSHDTKTQKLVIGNPRFRIHRDRQQHGGAHPRVQPDQAAPSALQRLLKDDKSFPYIKITGENIPGSR